MNFYLRVMDGNDMLGRSVRGGQGLIFFTSCPATMFLFFWLLVIGLPRLRPRTPLRTASTPHPTALLIPSPRQWTAGASCSQASRFPAPPLLSAVPGNRSETMEPARHGGANGFAAASSSAFTFHVRRYSSGPDGADRA